MGVLVLDAETTGLPIKGRGIHAEGQPRIIELAWTLFDVAGAEMGSGMALNNSPGVSSSKEALAVHGISDRRKTLYGVEMNRALALFMGHLSAATMIVSYGLRFDMQMLSRELRLLRDDCSRLDRPGLRRCDLIQVVVDVHGLPRWISLEEAHKLVLGEAHVVRHRAVPDCAAAARVFWKLVELGKITP